MKRFIALSVVCLCLPLVGCDKSPCAKTSGTIMKEGQPVPRVVVTFTPESGRPGHGVTDEKGQFVITTLKTGDGAFPGWNKVTLAEAPVHSTEPIPSPGAPGARPPQIKENPYKAYASTATTPLQANVQPGTKNHFEFNIE